MDISNETDINKLKSLAYDTLIRLENEQNNLRIIQARLQQVQDSTDDKETSD